MQLPKLNFNESFDLKFRKDKDKFFIYDPSRKTWLLLTPEEWVRQHWVQYFLTVEGYAASALVAEKKLVINGLTKRIDLLITEKTLPKILVECKATHIKLTEESFDQIARYNSVIRAERIILSNALQHINAKLTPAGFEFVNFEWS